MSIEEITRELEKIKDQSRRHREGILQERAYLQESIQMTQQYFGDQEAGREMILYLEQAMQKLGYAEAHVRDLYFKAEELTARLQR